MDRSQLPSDLHLAWVYSGTLARALDSATWLETTRELRSLGWRVTLISGGPAGRHSIQGVEVLCTLRPDIYFLRQVVYHLGVLRLLAAEWTSLDIVLFHQMAAPWILSLRFVRWLTGRHCPLLAMDTRDLHQTGGTWKDALRRSFFRFAHWLANHFADGQTAITQRMVELVHIPSKQFWGIWPSGVIPEQFAVASVDRVWPALDEPIHLVHIGLLLHERNLLPLSEAVERANSENMQFVFSLVGDGPERPALEQFARQTDGRVRVRPPVPHDQVPGVLSEAHVGVTSLPAPDNIKYQASSPIKLFEYMAAGLPVLAIRNPCHTDVVGRGGYAFWAEDTGVEDLLAALRSIWDSRASLKKKGREAASAAQEWTWEAAAKKLNTVLESGLAGQ